MLNSPGRKQTLRDSELVSRVSRSVWRGLPSDDVIRVSLKRVKEQGGPEVYAIVDVHACSEAARGRGVAPGAFPQQEPGIKLSSESGCNFDYRTGRWEREAVPPPIVFVAHIIWQIPIARAKRQREIIPNGRPRNTSGWRFDGHSSGAQLGSAVEVHAHVPVRGRVREGHVQRVAARANGADTVGDLGVTFGACGAGQSLGGRTD